MKTYNLLVEELQDNSLQNLLKRVFEMYVTIQHYHWNVEGENFGEYHAFFGDLYEFAYNNVDRIAEQIRVNKEKVKLDETRVMVNESMTAKEMMYSSVELMNSVKTLASVANESAKKTNNVGLSSYLEDFIDRISKNIWMAESYTK